MQGYGLFPGLVWQLPKSSHSFYFISFPVAGHLQKDYSEAKEIKLLHQDFHTGLESTLLSNWPQSENSLAL